jgi:hypothetical protein
MRVDAAGAGVGVCVVGIGIGIGIDGYKLEATAGAGYDAALGAVLDFTKPNVCILSSHTCCRLYSMFWERLP